MHFLQSLDSSLFHFLNSTLANPVSDRVMPFLSGNKLFAPAVLVLAVWLVWKGGTRGRLCVLMLALLIPLGEVLVWGHLKDVIGRERPFTAEAAVQDLDGWLVVPARHFSGHEGRVDRRLWFFYGDRDSPFSLAAYRRLPPGD